MGGDLDLDYSHLISDNLPSFVEIRNTEYCGRVLVAKTALPAGTVILDGEPAFFTYRSHQQGQNKIDMVEAWKDFKWKLQDKETEKAFLFNHFFDGPEHNSCTFVPPQNPNIVSSQKDERLAYEKFCRILKFNAVQDVAEHPIGCAPTPADEEEKHQPPPITNSLYPVSALFAHSCRPNCHWMDRSELIEDASTEAELPVVKNLTSSGFPRRSRVVRLIRPVAAGQQLTVSYLSAEDLYKPTPVRRMLLFLSKDFLCKCERCGCAGTGTTAAGMKDVADDVRTLVPVGVAAGDPGKGREDSGGAGADCVGGGGPGRGENRAEARTAENVVYGNSELELENDDLYLPIDIRKMQQHGEHEGGKQKNTHALQVWGSTLHLNPVELRLESKLAEFESGVAKGGLAIDKTAEIAFFDPLRFLELARERNDATSTAAATPCSTVAARHYLCHQARALRLEALSALIDFHKTFLDNKGEPGTERRTLVETKVLELVKRGSLEEGHSIDRWEKIFLSVAGLSAEKRKVFQEYCECIEEVYGESHPHVGLSWEEYLEDLEEVDTLTQEERGRIRDKIRQCWRVSLGEKHIWATRF
eukprot:g5653.t1